MTEQPHREVAMLNAALELPSAERAAYLDQACAGDAALRNQVEALLEAHDQAEGFLNAPPAGLDFSRTGRVNIPLTEKPGDKIGRYKLLQQIGEGGCGVVYMAEQEEPVRRRVALKVIKLGMDTKQVIARFEAERQALALMDHPNIAKIYDAGVTVSAESTLATGPSPLGTHYGRPYFVMELVRGIKITDFCDENQLSTTDRLKLFIQVCQAIQHAHQKGVIHRDIKPSNILVTVNDGVPVPKVIDFGIAKATAGRLTDQTLFTAFEQFIGTPAYMSPEQAVMTSLDIDTRSDIYSLGVLLYELLTGRTPFDQKELLAAGLDEMRRTIREVEPVKPSTRLTQEFAAADKVGRVAPRAPSSGENACGAHGVTRPTSQLKDLIHIVRGDLDWIVMRCLEKDRVRRYETANGLATDIQRHLSDEPVVACPPSKLYKFQKLVRRNKLAFAAAGGVVAALLLGLALALWQSIEKTRAYNRAVAAERQAQTKEKQAQTEAAKSEQVARFLQDMLNGIGPQVALGRDTKLLREILDKTAERLGKDLTNQPEVEAQLRMTIGKVYEELGLYEPAVAMQRAAVKLRRSQPGNNDHELVEALKSLANALIGDGKLQEGETNAAEAVAIARRLPEKEHLAGCLNTLAFALEPQGRVREALAIRRQVVDLRKAQPPSSDENVAISLHNLAGSLRELGEYAEAEMAIREALAIETNSLPSGHPFIAKALNTLGALLLDQRRPSEAEPIFLNALEIAKKLHSDSDHPDYAGMVNNLGKALVDQGKVAEAEARFRQALAMQRKALPPKHPSIAITLMNVAYCLSLQKDRSKLTEAASMLQDVLNMQRELAGEDSQGVALAMDNLAATLCRLDRFTEAEKLQREGLRKWRKVGGDEHPIVAKSLDNLTWNLMHRHQHDEALKLCNELLPPELEDRPQRADLLMVRMTVFARRGRWKEAAADAAKAVAAKPDPEARYGHPLTLLRLADDDRDGARRACQQTLAKFATTNDANAAVRMAMDCLIIPPRGVDVEAGGRLADLALSTNSTNSYYQFCKGLAEYRRGRFDGAAVSMAKLLESQGSAANDPLHPKYYAVLAMAQWQLQQPDQAKGVLAQALKLAENALPKIESGDLGVGWGDWVISQSLLAEAKSLIPGGN